MADDNPQITIPANLDGLEQAVERVIGSKEWAMEDLRLTLQRIRIHTEYFQKLKERPKESESIKKELSEKYFNSPKRTGTIDYILYVYPKRKGQ